MKKPQVPPPLEEIWKETSSKSFSKIVQTVRDPLVNCSYLHWDELRHRTPPHGLSVREWWLGIKLNRQSQYRAVPLQDTGGRPFQYLLPDPIPARLHNIDRGAGGFIEMPEQITNPETKDRYYVGSLIEEAITSSQLEGAATTRKIAKEMIRTGRQPRDRSERMILNNFITMKRIGDLKGEPLTSELVFEIHRLVTDQALDDASAAGRFRTDEEKVVVTDLYGQVYHEPPPASQLEARMAAMCSFANGTPAGTFVHPAIRAVVLHFWLAYDHPFVDGNGRTARALFYWAMLHHHYWLCEYISISHIIRKGPMRYQRAFLHTETDDNDLTYFILYHIEVMRLAVSQLHEYIRAKTEQLRRLQSELRGIVVLNHRQRDIISHALRHPNQLYTIESHRLSHNVVYETARRDLTDLAERGLLMPTKVGKAWRFSPAPDLEQKLTNIS
ncbi:MAG: Fic family protein [Thermoguttaceae bacterium]|jgi:Fic family protein